MTARSSSRAPRRRLPRTLGRRAAGRRLYPLEAAVRRLDFYDGFDRRAPMPPQDSDKRRPGTLVNTATLAADEEGATSSHSGRRRAATKTSKMGLRRAAAP